MSVFWANSFLLCSDSLRSCFKCSISDTPADITLTSYDVDEDPLTYSIVASPASGSLSGVLPNITYTPNLNYYGTDSFSFKVNDGLADSNTSTISITVNPVNDPPVAYDVNKNVYEDIPEDVQPIISDAVSDVENDSLTPIEITPFSYGVLSGVFPNMTYTSDLNYYGTDCITFKFNDSEFDSNVATGCAIILPVNDAPVADDQQITMELNTIQHIELTATDIENDTLTYAVISLPSHGTLFEQAPHLTYQPNRNYVGSDSFTFKANDGNTTSLPATISLTITEISEAAEQTSSDSGRFTVASIPKISQFDIYTDGKPQNSVSSLISTNKMTVETGNKIALRAVLDDEEASTNIIHVGIYMNTRDSAIKNSDTYLVYDMGMPLKVVDQSRLLSDVQMDTRYEGRSMMVDATLTFAKPMDESDIILEVWNQGRHPVYETIPSILKVTESKDLTGPNISGTVTMPEQDSKEPIRVFSTAAGKITEVSNNGMLALPNKDMSVRISGFIDNVKRGEKVNISILRPDDSLYRTGAYLSEDGSYVILTKLNTQWESGHYEIRVNCLDTDRGDIRFFVTDREQTPGQEAAILDSPAKLPMICKYLHGEITKQELVSYLQGIGWSQVRIDDFLSKNRQQYVDPNWFYYVAGLVPLLYILASVLGKKRPKDIQR